MSDLVKLLEGDYDDIFQKVKIIAAKILKIDVGLVTDELAIGDIPEWDSVANIKLLQALEEEFSIEIDVLTHSMLKTS